MEIGTGKGEVPSSKNISVSITTGLDSISAPGSASASLSASTSTPTTSTTTKNTLSMTDQTTEVSVNESDFFDQFLNINIPSNDNNSEFFQVLEPSSAAIPQFVPLQNPNKTLSLPNLNSPLESKVGSPKVVPIPSNKSDSEFLLNHEKIEISFNTNAPIASSNNQEKNENKTDTLDDKENDCLPADLSSSPTIPMDSPSMHSPRPIINEIKRVMTPPIPQPKLEVKQSFNKPPTFAVTKSSSLKLSDNTIPTYTEKARILKLLRKGLETYTSILSNITTDTIEPRADYLSNYLKSLDLHVKPRIINDLFAEIKNNKLGTNVLKIIGDPSFVPQFQNLLLESHRKRKHYNKRRQSKPTNSSSTSAKPTTLPPSNLSHQFPPIQRKPSVHASSKFSTTIDIVKIGSLMDYYHSHDDSNFKSIANLRNIPRCIESKSFLLTLKSSDPTLQSCIDGIPFNHSITYTKIPIMPNPQININLDTDQMVSYSSVLIDLSNVLSNSMRINNTVNLQLKSITKIYDGSVLIHKRCDPINGHFLKDSDFSNIVKLILPFQAKFWASLLNDFHNGSITFKKYDSLKISHTLFNNDDIVKFKDQNAPVHSFIWDFNTHLNEPISFNIDNEPSTVVSKATNVSHHVKGQNPTFSARTPNTAPLIQNSTFQSNTSQISNMHSMNNSFAEYIPPSQSTNVNIMPKQKPQLNLKPNLSASMSSISHQQQHSNNNNHSAIFPQHISFSIDDFTNNSQHSASSAMSNPPLSSSLQTSTPNSYNSKGRGHKRTRSRSMNEIDLLSMNLSNYISQNNPLMTFDDPTTVNFYQTINNSRNSAGTGVQQQNTTNISNSQMLNTSNTMSELSRLTFLDNSVSLNGTQFNDGFFNTKIEDHK